MKMLLPFFASLLFSFLYGQDQRALIIAIDQYSAPANYKSPSTARVSFPDLDGCINDGRSIYSIINSKFNFLPGNIDTLFNEKATRVGILDGMEKLYNQCKKGDIAFIYYAGHGSQVRNKKTIEYDKKDESIVPADSYKEGVKDIRDKELAAFYNKFLDKGIKLTVIMDCCHSGSLSRGFPGQKTTKFRFMPDPDYDVEDASQPVPPETRQEESFLIISASQDNEFAEEEFDENRNPHGAFTIALLAAINQQSVDASALNLFISLRAVLKSNGNKQEPVLAGTFRRQQQTLFGIESGILPDKSLVAISGFKNGKVELQGGYALSLHKENELVKFKEKDTLVKLRIDTVLGINKSLASVIQGNIKDLKPGNLLEVTNWVSSSAPLLKVYIPSGSFTKEQVDKFAAIAKEVKRSIKNGWTDDLEKTDPYLCIYFDNDKCFAKVDTQSAKMLTVVSAQNILKRLQKDSTIYFELPPSKDIAEAIVKRLKQSKNLLIVDNPNDANYTLYGTLNKDGLPAYGLRRTQTSARDSLESMPLQTKSFDNNVNNLPDSIYDYAMRLSRVRGWLQLSGPGNGNSAFPFEIKLFNLDKNKFLDSLSVNVGDNMALYLVAASDADKYAGSLKYVYAFVIDKNGKMTPAYPDGSAGNQSNKFPKYTDDDRVEKELSLFEYIVSEPVGTDTYIVLATDEQIPNYSLLFSQDGVRGIEHSGKNPLTDLLNLGNEEGTRGFRKSPSNWSLLKLSVKTKQ